MNFLPRLGHTQNQKKVAQRGGCEVGAGWEVALAFKLAAREICIFAFKWQISKIRNSLRQVSGIV